MNYIIYEETALEGNILVEHHVNENMMHNYTKYSRGTTLRYIASLLYINPMGFTEIRLYWLSW